MAKVVHSVSLNGEFTYTDMEIVETTKESINTYDIAEILKRFDGRSIRLAIQEQDEIQPKSIG
jgi:predicted RNA-binding protein